MPFSVMESEADDSASCTSDSTVGVDILQSALAQTIVYSFLLFNESNGGFNPSLVPSIIIAGEKLVVHMYDCKEDILLASRPLELFNG